MLSAMLLDATRAELEPFGATSGDGRERLVGGREGRGDGLSVAEQLGPVRSVAVFFIGTMLMLVRGRVEGER